MGVRSAGRVRKSHFFRFRTPVPTGSADNPGRHDFEGCGSAEIFIFAPSFLDTKFLHCSYFSQYIFIVGNSRLLCPFDSSTTGLSGMVDRQPGYFLSNTSGTYIFCLPDQVRKSIFLQNRTLPSCRNRLIKFFC